MKKYIALFVALFVIAPTTASPWFWEKKENGNRTKKSKWLYEKEDKTDWKKIREERRKRKEARRAKRREERKLIRKKEEERKLLAKREKKKVLLESPAVTVREPSPSRVKSLGHDISVKDISSKKKDAFRVDLNITSTVPVNVEVKDDRLVVQQVGDGLRRGDKMVSSGKVVSMNMKEIGQKKRRFIYKVPAWPEYVACFEEKDKVDVYLQYQHAGNSYSSSGHTQDMSKLVFGENPICIRNILLASKLVEAGKVTDNTGGGPPDANYLANVAPLKLCFDGSIDDVRFSLGYMRHFRDNDISLGFHVPFVFRKHSLKLTTTGGFIAEDKTKFEERYGSGCGDCFKEFVKDILCKKDSSLTESDTEVGIGDISMFINFEFQSKDLERIITGLRVLLPTARERDIHKLWCPELGNGGFAEASAFASLLHSYSDWFNLHLLVQATYGFAAYVPRRVPSWKEFDGSSTRTLGDILAMGEYVNGINGTSFKDVDTIFRGFSTETTNIRIRRGAEFFFRIGNMFEKFISEKGFADIFYDLRFKGSDYISGRYSGCKKDCVFEPSILKHNTHQVEHRLGVNFSYQFDNDVRFMIGGLYSIAGRNIPKTIEGNASLHIEF